MLQALRASGFSGKVATTAYRESDAAALRAHGSDVVLMPFAYAAKEAADELVKAVGSPA